MGKYKNICVNTDDVPKFIEYFKSEIRKKYVLHPLDDLLTNYPIVKVLKNDEYLGELCHYLILVNPSLNKISSIKKRFKNSLVIINQELSDACLIFDFIDESLIFWKKDTFTFNSLFTQGQDVRKIF